LLWDQYKNYYIGYLDFEDKMNEYQEFALQCQLEIESTNSSFNNVIINNITVHSLNILIFELATKLEYVGIHIIGLIYDGTGENWAYIKSFDWYISKWTCSDIVEVNFNKDKKSFYKTKIIESNFEKIKFIISLLDNSETIEVNQKYIRLLILSKSKWKINEMCKYKSFKDNQWYLTKIVDYNLDDIIIEISKNMEKWKVFNQYINNFLPPVYNVHKLSAYYKSVNPIMGKD
ncbi:4926_t:CDS:2, partial [Diversispora eburnea]